MSLAAIKLGRLLPGGTAPQTAKKPTSGEDHLVHVGSFLALSCGGRDRSVVGSDGPFGTSSNVEKLEVQEYLPSRTSGALAAEPSPSHSLYQGFDISDAKANAGHLEYDLESDVQVVFCDTYTRGAYDVFVVSGSHNLVHICPDRRFCMSQLGPATFIRSSCLTKLRQCCNGALVAFLPKGREHWRLGVVRALWYRQKEGDENYVELFVWNGPLNSEGVPELLLCEDWSALKTHLTLSKFAQDEVTIFFVNQVNRALAFHPLTSMKRTPESDRKETSNHPLPSQIRGPVPLGGSIAASTRNTVDGGVQCSRGGPDYWPIPKPKFEKDANQTFRRYPLVEGDIGCPNLLVNNRACYDNKRRRVVSQKLSKVEPSDSDTYMFHQPPKRVAAHDQRGMLIVVEDAEGKPLGRDQSTRVPEALKDKFCIGSMQSASSASCPVQEFFCLSKLDLERLTRDYKDGLDLNSDYSGEIDAVLRLYSSCSDTYKLLFVDKVAPPQETRENGYNYYVRIFGGDGAPLVDESFETYRGIDGFTIHHKVAPARECSQHPPLSIGLNHAPFHGIRIQSFYLPLLNSALGKRGTYKCGRSVMKIEGQNSYLGPRKDGRRRQPTTAEGPNENVPHEERFHYHLKTTNHFRWPFVQKLANYLTGVTSQAAYHFYPHLAKLFPISNSIKYQLKFCTVAILTANFCSSCHTDGNDIESWCHNTIIERLRSIVDRFDELSLQGIEFVRARQREAVESLKHLLWWGTCRPTTCCYQYLCNKMGVESTPEVYQWFLCPGLGTTYRIRNYWTHIMLAGLFSHCTSAPIYIVSGRAYFGKCPHFTMFAWGAG